MRRRRRGSYPLCQSLPFGVGFTDGSMFAVSLEESMDRMDADGLAEEHCKRSRAAAAGAAVSDLRSAVDAAMEMQQVAKKARSASSSLSQSFSAMDLDRGAYRDILPTPALVPFSFC